MADMLRSGLCSRSRWKHSWPTDRSANHKQHSGKKCYSRCNTLHLETKEAAQHFQHTQLCCCDCFSSLNTFSSRFRGCSSNPFNFSWISVPLKKHNLISSHFEQQCPVAQSPHLNYKSSASLGPGSESIYSCPPGGHATETALKGEYLSCHFGLAVFYWRVSTKTRWTFPRHTPPHR